MKIALVFFLFWVGYLGWSLADIPLDSGEGNHNSDKPFSSETQSTFSPSDEANKNAGNDGEPTPAQNKKCQCAVFDSEIPSENAQPIITQSPMDVACDDQGEQNCIKLCSAIAKAAQENGPKLLCAALGHYKQLKASVHSRICGATGWTYTGLTSPDDICCHEGLAITCEDMPDDQPLN